MSSGTPFSLPYQYVPVPTTPSSLYHMTPYVPPMYDTTPMPMTSESHTTLNADGIAHFMEGEENTHDPVAT